MLEPYQWALVFLGAMFGAFIVKFNAEFHRRFARMAWMALEAEVGILRYTREHGQLPVDPESIVEFLPAGKLKNPFTGKVEAPLEFATAYKMPAKQRVGRVAIRRFNPTFGHLSADGYEIIVYGPWGTAYRRHESYGLYLPDAPK